jgi:hypothetical protein
VSAEAVSQDGAEERDQRGRFRAGNAGALKHGLYSTRAQDGLLARQGGLREAIEARREELLSDLGGADAVGVLKHDAVSTYFKLSILHETLWQRVVEQGALTPKGRTRAAVTLLLQVNDRLVKLATQLGLERKPKAVLTLAELAADVRAREAAPTTADLVESGDGGRHG